MDLRTMEIGRLCRLVGRVAQLRGPRPWLHDALRALRDIRNALAHRQTVSASKILDPSLQRLVDLQDKQSDYVDA
jgi:hypothetical protein